MSLSLVAVSCLAVCLVNLAGCVDVSTRLSAVTELVIPVTSDEDVEFTCEVLGSEADGYSPLWEISGRQIRSTSGDRFIINTPSDNRSSNLTVTQQGRDFVGLSEISVECHADNPTKFRLVRGKQTLSIVQFDAPGRVQDLELIYNSQSELRLQWTPPSDLPSAVPVSYSINITNTDTGTLEQSYETAATYVSVDQNTAQTCQSHTFSVTANNTAGTSPPATIIHSIPISLNITPVTQSQRVASLSLSTTTGPNITVSFKPATSCGAKFPVLNHTVGVEGLEGEIVVEGAPSSLVSVSLTSANISQLRLDMVVSVVITACTELTCLSPRLPLVAVTTDTQEASVVFHSTAISLNCSFAVGSSATGCLFVFRLTNQDLTENVTVNTDTGVMFNTSCGQLSNTRGAYDEGVLVYDVERDGSIGSQSISVTVTVNEDPDNFTCPLPTNEVEVEGDEVLSAGEIAGIVVGSVVLAIIVAATVAAVVVVIIWRRKMHQRMSDETDAKVSLTKPGSYKWKKNTGIKKPKWKGTKNGRVRDDGSGEDQIDGPGEDEVDLGDLENFTPGHEDSVQKSLVAMMVLNCEGKDRYSVEPLDCPHNTRLISNLYERKKDGKKGKAYVRLYPEEL